MTGSPTRAVHGANRLTRTSCPLSPGFQHFSRKYQHPTTNIFDMASHTPGVLRFENFWNKFSKLMCTGIHRTSAVPIEWALEKAWELWCPSNGHWKKLADSGARWMGTGKSLRAPMPTRMGTEESLRVLVPFVRAQEKTWESRCPQPGPGGIIECSSRKGLPVFGVDAAETVRFSWKAVSPQGQREHDVRVSRLSTWMSTVGGPVIIRITWPLSFRKSTVVASIRAKDGQPLCGDLRKVSLRNFQVSTRG